MSWCHRSRYSETCADIPIETAQVCEYADLWHPDPTTTRSVFIGGSTLFAYNPPMPDPLLNPLHTLHQQAEAEFQPYADLEIVTTFGEPQAEYAAIRKSAAWMIQHFKRPAAMVPGSSMPAIQLSDAQLNTLAAFLLKLNPRNAEALQSAPDFAVQGALIYQKSQCGSCHVINGVGVKLGPLLNGLSHRRTEPWVVRHFRDPQALSPGSVMPPYRFSPSEMQNIVAYLFTLPE